MVGISRYFLSHRYDDRANLVPLMVSVGGICSKGSREWRNSYRHQVQGWRRPGRGEDNHEQALEAWCE